MSIEFKTIHQDTVPFKAIETVKLIESLQKEVDEKLIKDCDIPVNIEIIKDKKQELKNIAESMMESQGFWNKFFYQYGTSTVSFISKYLK